MNWTLARSLERLRDQVNLSAPDRDRKSDGSVGDLAHSARRSDHNPDANGIVRAIDITNDPVGGFDCETFSEELRASRDPRIKYVIWNRRMFSSYSNSSRSAWEWGAYSGSNKHTHHLHISIQPSADAASDTGDWAVRGSGGSRPPVEVHDYRDGDFGDRPKDLDKPVLRRGSANTGGVVGYLQVVLNRHADAGLDISGAGYGSFGPKTEQAVNRLQQRFDVTADGIVGWDGPDGRSPGSQATWPIIDRLASDTSDDTEPATGPTAAGTDDATSDATSEPTAGPGRPYAITSDDSDGLIAIVGRCLGVADAPWPVRLAIAEAVAAHNGGTIETTWKTGAELRFPSTVDGVRTYVVRPGDGLIAICTGLGLGRSADDQDMVARINAWQGPIPSPGDTWYGGPR